MRLRYLIRSAFGLPLELVDALDFPVGPYSGRPENPATARQRGKQSTDYVGYCLPRFARLRSVYIDPSTGR